MVLARGPMQQHHWQCTGSALSNSRMLQTGTPLSSDACAVMMGLQPEKEGCRGL